MFEELATFAYSNRRRVLFVAVIGAALAGVFGAGVSKHLSPYGVDDPTLRRAATIATLVIFIQILIGATMRHTGAGLAIPDFPWMFGRVLWPTAGRPSKGVLRP